MYFLVFINSNSFGREQIAWYQLSNVLSNLQPPSPHLRTHYESPPPTLIHELQTGVHEAAVDAPHQEHAKEERLEDAEETGCQANQNVQEEHEIDCVVEGTSGRKVRKEESKVRWSTHQESGS